MNFKKRFQYTKALVIVSITGSLLTYFISSYGLSEVYPFYSYKLFTQPLGSMNTYTEYRIYSKSPSSIYFRRNPIKETSTFDFDGYNFTFYFLVEKSLEHSPEQKLYKNRLLIFAKHVVPNQSAYKIVSETYHPKNLLNKGIPYDTATVITF